MQQQGGYPGGPPPGPPPGAGHARQMSGHGAPMPPHQPHHQRSGSQHSVHSVHSQHSQHGGPPPGHHMPPGPPPPHSRTHTPQHSQHNVFQAVMGARPGQVPQEDVGGPGQVKVYASAYSQIPVFEAMIRNISVMRRMSDSWVNATQILKVAGISKSVRTKILEKQVQTQMHEKVQGGYGKYQGTWIPLERGRILAEQYGVLQYVAPIFDFVPPPTGPPALPMRGGSSTPTAKTPGAGGGAGIVPGSAGSATGRMISPYAHTGNVPPPPPPQFVQQQMPPHGGYDQHGQPPQMLYPPPGQHPQQPQGGHMFYAPGQPQGPPPGQHMQHGPPPPHHMGGPMGGPPQGPPQHHGHQRHPSHPGMPPMGYTPEHQPRRLEPAPPLDIGPMPIPSGIPQGLAPAATINGHGGGGPGRHQVASLPPPQSDVYIDSYGQPHGISGSAQAPSFGADIAAPPAKRPRVDGQPTIPEEEPQESGPGETEEDDDEDARDKPPLPASFRLSTKPFKPRLSTASHRRRQQLLSLFQGDGQQVDVRAAFELASGEKPDWDVDMVIDEQGHTALHWACALARMGVIAQLIELGADIHRGNYSGETPLIRSVLTTNHAEAGTFSQLLDQHLGPSIRTLDHAYCSVIHHIALSAGLKGRAAYARGYMAAVLEWVAKEQTKERSLAAAAATPSATSGEPSPVDATAPKTENGTGSTPATNTISLKRLVDLQDVRGDTALNTAARMGSKPLVNLLLDAGGDKTKANKLGLRPVDFGVEVEALAVSTSEATLGGLKNDVKRPEKRSADVLKNISALFEDVNRTFDEEMEKHIESLNGVEKSVRVATRTLAERRQQVETARTRLGTLEQQAERVDNGRRALEKPVGEWTGRTPLRTEASLPPAFEMVPPSLPGVSDVNDAQSNAHVSDPALPESGEPGALVKLRRLAAWEDRVAKLLEERASDLEGDSADRAVKYRKVIAVCAKVSVDQVDDMLDGLMTAVESDGPAIDLTRIAGVVQRLRDAPTVA
ncbi:transcriptional regulator swi6 [Vanrija albida]|uniref:Transcriptional regulator swi6 n=1 Tax=Vanrija albida TaxID=181172 RepID=A0ABR3Q152_9TREE